MDEQKALRSIRGAQNRAAGAYFESIVEASLLWYKHKAAASIEKTPEPMKPLRPPNSRGQFLACYTKAAQPDFQGTLLGGRSVIFDAKHTTADRIEYSAVTEDQRDRLELHHNLGAYAFVLVGFGMEDFYRVPWPVWRDMKQILGHKHIKRTEIETVAKPLQYIAGVLKLLEDIPGFEY